MQHDRGSDSKERKSAMANIEEKEGTPSGTLPVDRRRKDTCLAKSNPRPLWVLSTRRAWRAVLDSCGRATFGGQGGRRALVAAAYTLRLAALIRGQEIRHPIHACRRDLLEWVLTK
jgi:hypothetical protein